MRFEYKQVEFNIGITRSTKKQLELNEMLNKHGREGWELVNFADVGGAGSYFVYVFKRPLSEFAVSGR